MRVKVAIPLLLAGIFAVLLAYLTRPKNPAPNNSAAQAAMTVGQSTPKTSFAQNLGIPSSLLLTPTEKNMPESNITTDDSVNEENEDYVSNRISELEDLGMTDDPHSLAEIESEFDNRDPRIQKAAVAAAIQFGSRDAIPALQDAYRHFDDPEQKLNIQKAIDFLELPSMAEAGNATAAASGSNSGN